MDGDTETPPAGGESGYAEVAVDVLGPLGARTYTYAVPPSLADLEVGEAVLVPFGRRQTLGIVVGRPPRPPVEIAVRPLAARVETGGPLVTPLGLALAREVADHYRAPLAIVLRSFLPSGLLDRVDLQVRRVAVENAAGPPPALDPEDRALLERLTAAPRSVRRLAGRQGRGAILQRLRRLEATGLVRLAWGLPSLPAAGGEDRRSGDGSGVPTSGGPPRGTPRGAAVVGGAPRTGERRCLPPAWDVPLDPRVSLDVSPPPAVAAAALPDLLDPEIPLLVEEGTVAGAEGVLASLAAGGRRGGRPVLVLVPDLVTLARVAALLRRAGAQPTVLHGDLAPADRIAAWDRVRGKAPSLLVGTRSILGAPLEEVGLVIVVDEHDPSYKSDRTPRLQGRDVALAWAAVAGAPAVLLSAAPSVESVGWGAAGRYRHVRLDDVRLDGATLPPALEIVDLRAELAAGTRGLLSRPLLAALEEVAAGRGGRVLLLMNRRGTASVVLCRDCGHVLVCRECGRALVYHGTGRTLRCHHCTLAAPPVDRCPVCASPRIRYLGGGTERVEAEVRARFPTLRVGRLDRDLVDEAEQRGLLAAFLAGAVDVLVGTSLAVRRLDAGTVTLLGVVSADVGLALPEERAAERTFQLLRLAARRLAPGGRGILQTYRPDHPAVVALETGDPTPFYRSELEARRRFRSPPFGHLVKLVLSGPDEERIRREAEDLARSLRRAADRVDILGPQPPFVPRRAGRWRQQLVLRGDDPVGLLRNVDLGPRWVVDVDPETLL